MKAKSNLLTSIVAVTIGLASMPVAFAGNHSNFGVERPGQACADFLRQKHPELKGAARSAEWGKCKADPAGYMKANS
jgi:hypothetical protein